MQPNDRHPIELDKVGTGGALLLHEVRLVRIARDLPDHSVDVRQGTCRPGIELPTWIHGSDSIFFDWPDHIPPHDATRDVFWFEVISPSVRVERSITSAYPE